MGHSFESFGHKRVPPSEVAESETEVDSLLSELPEELAERWELAHAHLGSEERRVTLEQYIEKRKKVLRSSVDSHKDPEHVSVVDKSPQAVINILNNIEKGPHEKLGAGQAGRVIASVRYPNVCYKVMFPIDTVPKGTNDISVEADLQDEVAQMGEMYGVRAPEVFSFVHEGDTRAITMERLNAVSLRDVINRKAELPSNFDVRRFTDSLEKYITELNNRGYYHRDLHDGNVMIDIETGNPYVIDFGHAKYTPLPDDAYDHHIIEGGQVIKSVLLLDQNMVTQIRGQAEYVAQRATERQK